MSSSLSHGAGDPAAATDAASGDRSWGQSGESAPLARALLPTVGMMLLIWKLMQLLKFVCWKIQNLNVLNIYQIMQMKMLTMIGTQI